MIDREQHPVSWVMLIAELDEATEHLQSLVSEMVGSRTLDEEEFSVQMGHIYAHLNRAWHARDLGGQIEQDQWDEFSQFPKDLRPVG